MCGSPNNNNADEKPPEWLKFLREEVRFEYNLTANRIAWFLTSQTFLLSAFVLGYFNDKAVSAREIFGDIIPFIGIMSSILLRISIFVSHKRIWKLSNNIHDYDNSSPKRFELDPSTRRYAMLYASFLPWTFCSMWITIPTWFKLTQINCLPIIFYFTLLLFIFIVLDIFLSLYEQYTNTNN